MDKHAFTNKYKIGSTDISNFTDYQGIGHYPLYKRYESVNVIIRQYISPEYSHFLAVPLYSSDEDKINWYVDEWNEIPQRLKDLEGAEKSKYQEIKENTLKHYHQTLLSLSGEELQVMTCVLRYIDDEFIYCADNKVFVLAWGMTPDLSKHIPKGELVQEAPYLIKYKLNFDAGEQGYFASNYGANVMLPQNTKITANDIPDIIPEAGYKFVGWTPEPLGNNVTSDMEFKAQYEKIPDIEPNPLPPPPPPQQFATIRFETGPEGKINGRAILKKPLGSYVTAEEVPPVQPVKGYEFKNWDTNPIDYRVTGDHVFQAVYQKQLPWYKRWWAWGTSNGCLKWLLWLLLALFLAVLLSWLLPDCHGCRRAVNGVTPVDEIVTGSGDTIDNNGYVRPVELRDGKLPDDNFVVAPIYAEDGSLPPIIREDGVPPVIADRLFLFLENDTDNIDDFAKAFKDAYPEDQYAIIGYDRDVKSLLIQVPSNERVNIRSSINSKIPNFDFIVFDEELYELNGTMSTTSATTPGWHLSAIKAQEGWEITRGNANITVAVIDDGIDAGHPIFKGRIRDAYNVYTQNNQLSLGEGHGTHTAGLAVGSTEFLSQGAAGVAPDCSLMPVQVVDNGFCPLSALVSGIMYAVHKDADVINVSIGPSFSGLNQLPVTSQFDIGETQFKNVEKLWNRVSKIAANKNTIIVYAAGNDDILSIIPPENRSGSAITVGAVDQNLYPTEFTNYGVCTDISAPGTEIYSSYPKGEFRSFDGTSMAAPIVSGTIALMKTLKKDLTVTQAYNVLYKTGVDVYGNLPPMVQVNLALDAVKRGDFSAPEMRQIRTIPGSEEVIISETQPSLLTEDGYVIIEETEPSILIIDTETGEVLTPGHEGEVVVDEVVVAEGRDYDAIRRQIKELKQQIKELEGQLPENKR